ncbi:hypothetical protein SEUCBS140593_009290 [Sporothrix eucalyptigena]|uniref:Uncharacterized protein n=1 Tax=Sporothrix eucalyptigena TaxID=1812306 RepID=A0ABP0CWR1_9PEZI
MLTAPAMSVSSSRASNISNMWSAETSRRGSNASSISPPSATDLDVALTYEKLGGVPMAVSASEGCQLQAQTQFQKTPAPVRRPLKHNTDPLERAYPKPEQDIDVGAALAREPLKWSLGHWKKNARDVARPTTTPGESKKRFEDIKDELRRAQQDMAKTSR